jgi:hypothetical protein
MLSAYLFSDRRKNPEKATKPGTANKEQCHRNTALYLAALPVFLAWLG